MSPGTGRSSTGTGAGAAGEREQQSMEQEDLRHGVQRLLGIQTRRTLPFGRVSVKTQHQLDLASLHMVFTANIYTDGRVVTLEPHS